MKVIAIFLLVAVAAAYAFPAEDNDETIVAIEVDPEQDTAQINEGLVRDKRQFGGEISC